MPRQMTTRVRWLLALLLTVASTAVAQDDPELPPRRRRNEDPVARRIPISLDGGASINPEVLDDVVDNTIGLTPDDREAYFRILKLTEKLGDAQLRTLAQEFRAERHAASPRYRQRPLEKFPVFVDLFQHPAEYRGRPVTLHGYFRRLVSYEAGKNEQGFQDLYEGWLYPDEGQSNPAVVIFTRKPEALPIGGDITEEVSVSGYFLKMYGYQAHDAARKAPLILAETVRWRPQALSAPWKPSSATYVLVTLGVVAVGLLIAAGVRQSRLHYEEQKSARWAQYGEFVPPEEIGPARPMTPSRNGSTVEPHH
jgi:hypothetical protein